MLTNAKFEALAAKKPPAKLKKYSDAGGLSIYHKPSGSISFVLRYRLTGKQKDLVIGHYPQLSLSEARNIAKNYQSALAGGCDPKLAKLEAKKKILDAVTVEQSLEYWLVNYVEKRSVKAASMHRGQFTKHIYPSLGKIALERCEARLWVQCFDDIASGKKHRAAPVAAGKILGLCKQALKYCRKRQFATSTALNDLSGADVGQNSKKGDRVLTWGELLQLWQWANSGDSYYRNLTKLMIIFGARTQELRLSHANEWDLEAMLWTVPKANSKTGLEIIRPIPTSLRPYIKTLKAQSKGGLLLGTLKAQSTVAGYKLYKKLDHASWSFHDLRRTFSTYLNDLGIDSRIVEVLLGHSIKGIEGIYNKSKYNDKKLRALDAWLCQLDNIEQSNVVRI